MYRQEDIDKIKLEMDNIVDEAMHIYKTHNEPTLEEAKQVYQVIFDFIKKKNKIIYGGYAQNKLIIEKNIDDGFYKEIDTPDVEFYSDEQLVDLIELCDLLKSKNFKYVQGAEGLHGGTYKIFVNFENYCDIAYMPKNIYTNLPVIICDQIKYIHPYFMLIDIYRVYCDPMTSYWRLNKSFTRSLKLYKYYPIISNNIQIKFGTLAPDDVLKTIRKHIIHNSNLIVVGSYAYNYYISKIHANKKIKINFYEVITDDINRDGNLIYKILTKVYGKDITVKEYYPFFEIFDYRIEYYYKNILVLRLYNNNDRCVVYRESEKKQTKFGTIQLVLLYLIANYNYYLINKSNENINYLNMFIILNQAKNDYLYKRKLTVLSNSPFQEFTFKCIGKPVSLDRQNKIKSIQKKSKGKLVKFRYEPKGPKGKIPEYKFDNISGNQNINPKYFIIKKY